MGLLIYLAGLGLVYYALSVGAISNYRGKVFILLGLLLLACIAIFRGEVGTDTANYEQMVGILRSPSEWYGVEPGFSALVWLLGLIADSDVAVVRLLAVVFTVGLLVYLYRADRDETFYLLAYFIPVSFYQYSMNALRIGLATIFLLLAVQQFRRHRDRVGFGYLFAGWLFHYSLVFSIAYLLWAGRMLSKRTVLVVVGFWAIVTSFVIYAYGDYLIPRVLEYSDMGSPDTLSGLRFIAVISILMTGVIQSRLALRQRWYLVFSGFCLMALFWFIARNSYAGLRFLDLLAVVFPLAVLVQHGRAGLALNWKFKLSLMLGGAIGAAAVLRSFLGSAVEGATPWLPYEWIL